MRAASLIAAVLFSVSNAASAAGPEQNKAISSAGLAVPSIEIPSPKAPQRDPLSINPKIQPTEDQFNTADTIILTLNRQSDISRALKLLQGAGYSVRAYAGEAGAYMVKADVKNSEGPAKAQELAGYSFIKEVRVNQVVYSALAYKDAPKSARYNQQNMALAKIKVNEAQPDMNDTLVGLIQRRENIDTIVKELNDGGLKATARQDNHGGYLVMVDVTGLDAADYAIGLAKYYYITEVQVGRQVYDKLFASPSRSRSAYAVKIGTVKGGINNSPVAITINKLAWTITGKMNNGPVDIKIDNAAKTITGAANQSPVDLNFAWSPEEISVRGEADSNPVQYTVNWKNGLLEGSLGDSPLKLEFDMQEGVADVTMVRVTGYAGNSAVDLAYNKINGHIGGSIGGSPFDLNLVNCDLYDFLNYFFLFSK